MPAAAVIPAPVAYIKVAAVKKLVVGCLVWCTWSLPTFEVGVCVPAVRLPSARVPGARKGARCTRAIYFEKIRVFKAGVVP